MMYSFCYRIIQGKTYKSKEWMIIRLDAFKEHGDLEHDGISDEDAYNELKQMLEGV